MDSIYGVPQFASGSDPVSLTDGVCLSASSGELIRSTDGSCKISFGDARGTKRDRD